MRTPSLYWAVIAFLLTGSCGGGQSDSTPSQPVADPTPLKPETESSELTLSFPSPKTLRFDWTKVSSATHYSLRINPDGQSGYTPVGADIPATSTHAYVDIPLLSWINAQFVLYGCEQSDCKAISEAVTMTTAVAAQGIGYFKPHHTDKSDHFGSSVSLSGDGKTLAVGAKWGEAKGCGSPPPQGVIYAPGSVYIFTKQGNQWQQHACLQANNTHSDLFFGYRVDLNHAGDTVAISAILDSSNSTGINNSQEFAKNMIGSGAAYIFKKQEGDWRQTTFFKASNAEEADYFGRTLSLSGDGKTLAVGADGESSASSAINGNQSDNSAPLSGAVYLFRQNTHGKWHQQAYLKASNARKYSHFGSALDLSDNGNTLVVGAEQDNSSGKGINGDQSVTDFRSGAAYVFDFMGDRWRQSAFLKSQYPRDRNQFGHSVGISGDGEIIAVGAQGENSGSLGVNGDQRPSLFRDSGAVYVFEKGTTGRWRESAYLKAINTQERDAFGQALSLSRDGKLLAVGAPYEDSDATAFNGDPNNDLMPGAGAVFLYKRQHSNWQYATYIKASNTDEGDSFGASVALSADGDTLAVGAPSESSAATHIGADQSNNDTEGAGAVYLY